MLEEKLVLLKKELIDYANLVEAMIEKSMTGLLRKDRALLDEVVRLDERKANAAELRVDETCMNLIAQYQPAAGQLRTLLMTTKMSNDLERMGDHAVNIVESAMYLIERPAVKPLADIPLMSQITMKMLADAISAFINEDAGLARAVCLRDNEVDDLKNKVLKDLVGIMTSDSAAIERSLHLLRISGNLERIADLSTNIGEDVLFMVEGRVIKHHREDEDEDEAAG